MTFQEKNGWNNNEMANVTMARVENVKTSNRGFLLTCEIRDVPVSFVNGIRRIILSEIPTVVIQDVQILENTSQLPHEMLKHRFEMLPINVTPDDAASIRDGKVELHIIADKNMDVTTDDFAVQSTHDRILMRDRDLDTPLLFIRLRQGEKVHIKGRLALENKHVSQVCTTTTGWHIDPELAKTDKKNFVEAGGDPRHFDNFTIQRSYSRDSRDRPNWFDFSVESVGVLQSKVIFELGLKILRKKVADYVKEALENIAREPDDGSYKISLEQGGHTIGALFQEVIYSDKNVEFVSYDILHPLKNTMVLRFHTKKSPESILKTAKETIEEYCSIVEKVL
jgi:DNA-directed RNA polymerase II subunit RPB3